MNTKDCKGCYSNQFIREDRDYSGCEVLHSYMGLKSTVVKDISICPCVECLIKVMCNKQCERYKKHYNLVCILYMLGSKNAV